MSKRFILVTPRAAAALQLERLVTPVPARLPDPA